MYGPRGPWPDDVLDGCYVNYPDVDLADWEYLYYKDAYPRLQSVKARWDPAERLQPRPVDPAATRGRVMSRDWWMYHGDLSHSGEATASDITTANVSSLELRHSIDVPGSILSTPAIVDGCVFVGLANTLDVATQNGGQLLKIGLESGRTLARFEWAIPKDERDTHGFCGMGVTPAVAGGRVVFSAFNGRLYCLSESDLRLQWVTDLRYADPAHNQPVTNDFGGPAPKAAGWSSPVVCGDRVYVGMGEGENPQLYGFVYCLDANTGDVIWIFCTCQFEPDRPNQPNELPADTVVDPPEPFTTFKGEIAAKGASVWSSIAHDPESGSAVLRDRQPRPGRSPSHAGLHQQRGRPARLDRRVEGERPDPRRLELSPV